MVTTIIPIDGKTNLQTQHNSLRFIELSGPSKVLDYAKKPGQDDEEQKVNLATAQDIGLADDIPDLALIVVGPGDNAVSIIAQQLGAGKVVAFHSRVFVDGVEKEMLGFR